MVPRQVEGWGCRAWGGLASGELRERGEAWSTNTSGLGRAWRSCGAKPRSSLAVPNLCP